VTPSKPSSIAAPPVSEARRYQQLRAHLPYLKLNDAADALPRILDAARSENLSMTAALERLLELEVNATEQRRLTSRLRFAWLPEPWTLTDFDFAAQPGVDEPLIRDLATLRFLDDASNVVRRPTRCRQDHARGRAGPLRGRCRTPGLLHHRRRTRRPLPQGRHRRTLVYVHAVLRRPTPAGDRRMGLPPALRRRRLRPVPGDQPAIPQIVHDPDHQRRYRRLGHRVR
jgi:hypothetical protein